MMSPTGILLFSCALVLSSRVAADWGDYVDPTFNCPATTTCPVVCVAGEFECPPELTCQNGGLLCSDGTCSDSGEECDDELESPCLAECAPIACKKVVDNFDACFERFGGYYDNATECAAEEEASVELVSATNPWFIFLYTWISVVTVAVLGWCAFNQRILPVSDSTKPLLEAAEDESDSESESPAQEWTQMAYKWEPIGLTLYIMTELTMWGFHVLLGIVTILYYMQQEEIDRWEMVFYSEEQVLLVFVIVWVVGFVFNLSLKWPSSVRSLFLRRCTFAEATHVAVFAPYQKHELHSAKGSSMKKFVDALHFGMNKLFTFVYSDVNRPTIPGSYKLCRVEKEADGTRSFYFRLRRYNFEVESQAYVPGIWMPHRKIADFIESKNGLNGSDVKQIQSIIGPNTIRIKKPSFWKEVCNEFNKGWYTYQSYLVWTWFPLWYYYMALVETVVRVSGGLVVAYFKYRNAWNLYRLGRESGNVEVVRDGSVVPISHKEVVPGDVLCLKPGPTFCDMVVVSSEHVLVDESGITGESSPVAKTEVDVADSDKSYRSAHHKIHTISAGSKVLEAADNSIAIVTRTGSYTAKGVLLRSVLSYERHQFKFDIEVQVVIFILFLYAIFGFSITVYFLQESPVYAWFYGMFVVAAALPPLLPTVFVVSVGISDDRLAKKRIACSNSEGILVAGKVKVAFFDKTGTLTKQGLDFLSVRTFDKSGSNYVMEPSGSIATGMAVCHSLTTTAQDGEIVGNAVDQVMFNAAGATMDRREGEDFRIIDNDGNALKVLKRFEFDHHRMTQSVIVEDGSGRTFAYVKGSAENIRKCCREDGLPEGYNMEATTSARNGVYQIAMAMKEITFGVPRNLVSGKEQMAASEASTSSASTPPIVEEAVLIDTNTGDADNGNQPDTTEATRDELQVQFDAVVDAVGDSLGEEFLEPLTLANITREDIESHLTFVGFINFKNMLKEEAAAVLEELREGDIRSFMITGDNIFTGLHIAKESGMIGPNTRVVVGRGLTQEGKVKWVDDKDNPVVFPTLEELSTSDLDLAVTGDVWAHLSSQSQEYRMELAKYIRVFGRCTPSDKVAVVSTFVKAGYVTLMCGDGGNDCGALKTAHVGIALSDAEASTVSPFTSMDKAITSVPEVLKEGRCALASAFSSYKYMIMYGQVATVNQIATAYFYVTFSDWAWVFMDGIWVLALAFALPLARAAKKLAPQRPTSSLLGPHTMASTVGVLLINIIILILGMKALFNQEWYQCRQWGSTDISNILTISDNYEAGVIFLLTGFQLISAAAAYNFGFTHRAPWIRNFVFVFLFLSFTVLHFMATLWPSPVACIFRVNCTNENVVKDVYFEDVPIINPFNTTVMPTSFNVLLAVLMVVNLFLVCSFEYFIVNGLLKKIVHRIAKRRGLVDDDEEVDEVIDEAAESDMKARAVKRNIRMQPSRNFSEGFNQMMSSNTEADFHPQGIENMAVLA